MAAHGECYCPQSEARDARAPGGAEYVTQVQKPESTVLAVSLAREPQSEHARTSTQMERAGTGRWAHSRVSPLT